MSAWLYERMDSPVLPDSVYDSLCRFIYDNWDLIKHRHKNLINKEMLLVTASQLEFDKWPSIIKGAAIHWLKENEEKTS